MDVEENENFIENVQEILSVSENNEKEFLNYNLLETALSDSEEELEEFNPMPYAFILKDVLHHNQLVISPEKLHKARVSCPSFHVLLDHTIAVIWCFYSKSGHDKLGTSQLHWGIKFLEGLRNWHWYTPDVLMVIGHLEEALIERSTSFGEESFKNRYNDDTDIYPDVDGSRTNVNLHTINVLSNENNENCFNQLIELNSKMPSIILSNMFENNLALCELVKKSNQEASKNNNETNEEDEIQNGRELILAKDSFREKRIQQMQEIMNLFKTFRDLCFEDDFEMRMFLKRICQLRQIRNILDGLNARII